MAGICPDMNICRPPPDSPFMHNPYSACTACATINCPVSSTAAVIHNGLPAHYTAQNPAGHKQGAAMLPHPLTTVVTYDTTYPAAGSSFRFSQKITAMITTT